MQKSNALKLREPQSTGIDDLIGLARQKSKAGRKELFATVRDLFLEGHERLSDRERALMGDILRQLITDVEKSVRRDLAERLSEIPQGSNALVLSLANNDFEVAHPILLNSDLLQDIDLIEIIRHRTQSHQLAVAMRQNVTEDVSQALVDTGNTDVITALLHNEDAEISRNVMAYLVEESKRVNSFQEPLVHRRDLSPDLARKMYWWVSAALRKHIVDTFDVDALALDEAIGSVVNDVIEKEERAIEEGDASQRTVDELHAKGKLNGKVLIDSLRQGEISLFETALAKLTRLNLKMTRRLIYEPGGEGIAMACKAINMQPKIFSTIYELTRLADPLRKAAHPKELDRVNEFYRKLKPRDAKTVVGRWRQSSEYNHAIARLEKT